MSFIVHRNPVWLASWSRGSIMIHIRGSMPLIISRHWFVSLSDGKDFIDDGSGIWIWPRCLTWTFNIYSVLVQRTTSWNKYAMHINKYSSEHLVVNTLLPLWLSIKIALPIKWSKCKAIGLAKWAALDSCQCCYTLELHNGALCSGSQWNIKT